ncbi:transglycosylase SLT domain-containing protein [Gordonia sp. TBRC 11910]|uniref:Transglycosylase SLT domain-containing protein n=1 Tax=Gordonia asplenii TaxID=2725283 RepID=A0A848L340_9ACTN|nr:transglycosylase SLT domain-containing protein [Gordonia asplenii]NMO04852.1 transglycosylase SLT domain-containing protein [Gordonia asplenii]
MPAVATMTRRARHAARSPKRFAAGAVTFAVAAGVSAGAVSASTPAQVEPAADAHNLDDQGTLDALAAPAPTTAKLFAPTHTADFTSQAPAASGFQSSTGAVKIFSKYQNNLDGWIRESLDILRKNHIPATYEGIMRNVMRESTGDPRAINLSDSNAAAGIPSKGLLQVIDPTFAAYHVPGTAFDIWNPVSNIVAACNYAAHNYGSMDNVNSAY